jgi:hypothetical protein
VILSILMVSPTKAGSGIRPNTGSGQTRSQILEIDGNKAGSPKAVDLKNRKTEI